MTEPGAGQPSPEPERPSLHGRKGGAARRWLGRAGWALLGALATGAVVYLNAARRGGELQTWHRVALENELHAETPGVDDLEDYLALESRLFAETRQELGSTADGMPYSRFDPASDTWPERFGRDWNRTWELAPAAGVAPAGGALLLHGLSDSPYSMRALGELLASRDWYVLALRSPGHGTAPAALTRAHRDDWRRAVRIGARAVADRIGSDRQFVIAGYSNGAVLAVDYALATREDEELPRPDRLVLVSPALALGRLAAAASWQRRLAALPGLHELGWVDVLPEYDPWKYNSFPIQAAEQIYELSEEVARRLARSRESGGGLPPVLAFQSAVDDTVPVPSALPRLVQVLDQGGAASELVLFDVNRIAHVEYFLRRDILALVDSFVAEPHPFALTLVTNRSAETGEVEARRRAPGGEWVATPLGLSWPPAVYSLSHVALPFQPDDPFYGAGEGAGGPFPLGRLEPRGERAAITVPIQLLMRLRYNPFFAVIDESVAAFLDGAPADADG